MIYKNIIYFSSLAVISCDEKCDLAKGINHGRIISEGGHCKPKNKEERLNKWCCRECERCLMISGAAISTHNGQSTLFLGMRTLFDD